MGRAIRCVGHIGAGAAMLVLSVVAGRAAVVKALRMIAGGIGGIACLGFD
ncbi:MAG: hypothetical protein QOG99_2932 [Frankiales bacterium]|jgi:hypothetical protein|nr:hypothetical protein [Frankiales bacterium]